MCVYGCIYNAALVQIVTRWLATLTRPRISQITRGVDFEDFRGFLNSFRIFEVLVKSNDSGQISIIPPPRDGSIRAIRRSRSQLSKFHLLCSMFHRCLPAKSTFLADTITNFKSASSALFNAILIPFFSISFFELLIPAVSEIITG